MPLRLVPFTEKEKEAAREFNARVTSAGARMEFLLPEEPISEEDSGRLIRSTHYLALDGEFARGGCLLVDMPAWLGGSSQRVINCQSPLSEGSADRKYGFVAVGMMKFMRQQSPYLFALGMGSENTAWARFIKASGWTLTPVPFFFRVNRARRFLRQIGPLRASAARRVLAEIAARSGAGTICFASLHSRSLLQRLKSRELCIEPIMNWGPWADELWEEFRNGCSFAISRDSHTLRELYPESDSRILKFVVSRNGRPVVWLTALNTRMRDDRYFGDLQVATILDYVGRRESLAGAVSLCSDALAREGADLIISNQSHQVCIKALRDCGFIQSASNYIFGASKELHTAIASQPDGYSRVHMTRGDADGRIHL